MSTAIETELRVADWQQDKTVLSTQHKRRQILDTLDSTREKLAALREVLADGDERLVALRADEIVNGNRKSEQHETLMQSLTEAKEQIRGLEREEQALVMAERTVSAAIREAERVAKAQAGARLVAATKQEVKKVRALIEQAQTANERLHALDAELRASGLLETGGKQLVLLGRTGCAWNALSPKPIQGPPIHVEDWLDHVDRLLGD